jgi:hypothetical protein
MDLKSATCIDLLAGYPPSSIFTKLKNVRTTDSNLLNILDTANADELVAGQVVTIRLL